jgi:hypothetical protein
VRRIGTVIAAVLPAGVAAWAPASSTGQRVDRVGFLVAGLLVGFGLSRLTAWMSPPAVLAAAAARHAARTAHPSVSEAVADTTALEHVAIDGPAVPDDVDRPVLFDHAREESVVAAEIPVAAAAPVDDVPVAEPAAPPIPAATAPVKRAKGGKKKARPAPSVEAMTAETEPAAPVVTAGPEVAVAPVPEPSAPVADAADTAAAETAAVEPAPAAVAEETPAEPVDLVGLAARALATQMQPAGRDVANVFSALDATRVASPKTTPSRSTERSKASAAEATAVPARGEAPPTGKRVTVRSEPPSDAVESARDERRPEPTSDGSEPSVVELLAKRAAANGSSVWSLAMAGQSGSATWALAPTAEAARKAAEDAVREAVDSAGRPDTDGGPVDRGARPIVGRIPQRDR